MTFRARTAWVTPPLDGTVLYVTGMERALFVPDEPAPHLVGLLVKLCIPCPRFSLRVSPTAEIRHYDALSVVGFAGLLVTREILLAALPTIDVLIQVRGGTP